MLKGWLTGVDLAKSTMGSYNPLLQCLGASGRGLLLRAAMLQGGGGCEIASSYWGIRCTLSERALKNTHFSYKGLLVKVAVVRS